jgi:hypothetical protein
MKSQKFVFVFDRGKPSNNVFTDLRSPKYKMRTVEDSTKYNRKKFNKKSLATSH